MIAQRREIGVLWLCAALAGCGTLAPQDDNSQWQTIDLSEPDPVSGEDGIFADLAGAGSENGSGFIVDLGQDLQVDVGAEINIEARISGASENAKLFYAWAHTRNLADDAAGATGFAFVRNENFITIDTATVLPIEGFPDGGTFALHVRALELTDGGPRRSGHRILIQVGDAPPPSDDQTFNDPNLEVFLGGDLELNVGQTAEVSAIVTGQHPDGRLFYAWEYFTDLGGSGIRSVGPSYFTTSDTTVNVDPAELFSAEELADGVTFMLQSRVMELSDEAPREAVKQVYITVGDGLGAPDSGADGGGTDSGSDGDSDPDETPNDGNTTGDDEGEENGEQEGESGDNGGSGGNNGNGGDDEGEEEQGEVDPCEGVSGFQVIIPAQVHMSLFLGTLRLAPVICGGTPPLSYSWSPIDNLVDAGGPLGSAPGSIETPDADFGPTGVGPYSITVTVTDALSSVANATYNITVNSYSPLVANGGNDTLLSTGDSKTVVASATGGSGSYSYAWSPGNVSGASFSVPTGSPGESTYTVTVTDTVTSSTATDELRVVVESSSSSSCTSASHAHGLSSGRFVAFDSNFGAAGQAVVASGRDLVFVDLSTGAIRGSLLLPSDANGLAIDTTRRRAFISSRLSGQFTRSVQIIDLDTPALGTNVPLTNLIAAARGLAVIPSTGEVLVAASGVTNGLMKINPASGTVTAAIQNIHHTNSFGQPIDVAVVENGPLAVAVVTNASSDLATLAALSDITYTPDTAPGGGAGSALPTIQLGGVGRAIAPDADQNRVIVGWNSGASGFVQVVHVSASSGAAGPAVSLGGAVVDHSLGFGIAANEAYIATDAGIAIFSPDFGILSDTLVIGYSPLSVQPATEGLLVVGLADTINKVCP
jgi:hypothetical protein